MSDDKSITLNIDGQEVQCAPGTNLVDAVNSLGKEIPHYCYHPHLSVSGNCRMCLVELGMPMKDRATGEPVFDEDGKQKIGFMPKPAIACSTKVAPGMHVKTKSDVVKDCQNGVMEFLLVNHPLDCPICDQAGECRLQEYATQYGRGYSRFIEEKNVKPKRSRIGPRVMLDDERCILCSRCIRFSKEIAKDDVLGFIDRGSYSTLTCYPGKELTNNYSLNTVDICPVGALTSTDFRFKMRVWFLKPVNSICTESSVGVNTQVWSREGKIYRITPRRNDAVNDSWMSDSGRALYKQVEADSRLREYSVEGEHCTFEHAARKAAELLVEAKGRLAFVGSGHMSVEEQFLMRELAKQSEAKVHYVHHEGEGDGLLVSRDRTPNLRGALLTRLIRELPANSLTALAEAIDAGEVRTLLVQGENVLEAGLTEAQLKKVRIIYIGTQKQETSVHAQVVLPSLSVFEKHGTFVNQQFRLQKFLAAVPPPQGLHADIAILAQIQANISQAQHPLPTVAQIWEQIGSEEGVLESIQFAKIPDTGLLLEAGAFANLPFCEDKTLHYDPKERAAASAEA